MKGHYGERTAILLGLLLLGLATVHTAVCAELRKKDATTRPAQAEPGSPLTAQSIRQCILRGKGWQGLVPTDPNTRGSILVEKARTSLPSPSDPNNTVEVQTRLDYHVAHGVVYDSQVIAHTNALGMKNSPAAVQALREFLLSHGKGGRRYNVDKSMVELAEDPRASGYILDRILADKRIWLQIRTSATIDMSGEELASQYCSARVRRLPDQEGEQGTNEPATSRPAAATLDVGRVRLFSEASVGDVMEYLTTSKETFEASFYSPGKVTFGKDVVLPITSREFAFTKGQLTGFTVSSVEGEASKFAPALEAVSGTKRPAASGHRTVKQDGGELVVRWNLQQDKGGPPRLELTWERKSEEGSPTKKEPGETDLDDALKGLRGGLREPGSAPPAEEGGPPSRFCCGKQAAAAASVWTARMPRGILSACRGAIHEHNRGHVRTGLRPGKDNAGGDK